MSTTTASRQHLAPASSRGQREGCWSANIGGDLYQVFGQLGDAIEEARPLLTPEDHARTVGEGRTLGLADQVAYALLSEESGPGYVVGDQRETPEAQSAVIRWHSRRACANPPAPRPRSPA
jgi:hypothetical protein